MSEVADLVAQLGERVSNLIHEQERLTQHLLDSSEAYSRLNKLYAELRRDHEELKRKLAPVAPWLTNRNCPKCGRLFKQNESSCKFCG